MTRGMRNFLAVLYRLAEGLLAVLSLICALFALKIENKIGGVRGKVYFCSLISLNV